MNNNQNYYNRNYDHHGYEGHDYTSWYNSRYANHNPMRNQGFIRWGREKPRPLMGNPKKFENKTGGATRNQYAPSQDVLNLEHKRKLEVTSSHPEENLKNRGLNEDKNPKRSRFEDENEDLGFQCAPNQDNLNLEHEQKVEVKCSQLEENRKDQGLKEDDAKNKASGIQSAAPNQDILKLEHKQKLEDLCSQLEENLKNQGLNVGWKFVLHALVIILMHNSHSQIKSFFISDF